MPRDCQTLPETEDLAVGTLFGCLSDRDQQDLLSRFEEQVRDDIRDAIVDTADSPRIAAEVFGRIGDKAVKFLEENRGWMAERQAVNPL
jgi:hypothetical protein